MQSTINGPSQVETLAEGVGSDPVVITLASGAPDIKSSQRNLLPGSALILENRRTSRWNAQTLRVLFFT